MPQVFLELIHQLNGAVFTLVILLLVVFWLLYKAGGIVSSYKIFEKKNETTDTKLDSMQTSLSKISATTDLLYQAHLSTVKSHSPLSLTTRGEDIARELSIDQKVSEHWDAIKHKLESKNPTNPYDIQTVSMDIARDCFDTIFSETEKNEIKTYAFKIGLNLLEIYPIIGIVIRNRIFKERSIDLGEIDKHDKAKTAPK